MYLFPWASPPWISCVDVVMILFFSSLEDLVVSPFILLHLKHLLYPVLCLGFTLNVFSLLCQYFSLIPPYQLHVFFFLFNFLICDEDPPLRWLIINHLFHYFFIHLVFTWKLFLIYIFPHLYIHMIHRKFKSHNIFKFLNYLFYDAWTFSDCITHFLQPHKEYNIIFLLVFLP